MISLFLVTTETLKIIISVLKTSWSEDLEFSAQVCMHFNKFSMFSEMILQRAILSINSINLY